MGWNDNGNGNGRRSNGGNYNNNRSGNGNNRRGRTKPEHYVMVWDKQNPDADSVFIGSVYGDNKNPGRTSKNLSWSTWKDDFDTIGFIVAVLEDSLLPPQERRYFTSITNMKPGARRNTNNGQGQPGVRQQPPVRRGFSRPVPQEQTQHAETYADSNDDGTNYENGTQYDQTMSDDEAVGL